MAERPRGRARIPEAQGWAAVEALRLVVSLGLHGWRSPRTQCVDKGCQLEPVPPSPLLSPSRTGMGTATPCPQAGYK